MRQISTLYYRLIIPEESGNFGTKSAYFGVNFVLLAKVLTNGKLSLSTDQSFGSGNLYQIRVKVEPGEACIWATFLTWR
jgi:hypothetical protein